MKSVTKAIGPYSAFLRVPPNKVPVYFSGVIGNNPLTGDIEHFEFNGQVRQAFENLQLNLQQANVLKTDIYKVTVFLTDMNNFSQMNALYSLFFGEHKPTRSTVSVLELPKNALFEIEVTAHVDQE